MVKRILVAVGGGIAAYKSATLVSRLVQHGHTVQVALSPAGEKFIGPATFAALTSRPVASDTFAQDQWPLGPHIELATDLDLMIIAPATADLLAKLSQGIADTLIPTLYLQVACPVLIAPAMSNVMWEKPSVQRNVQQLRTDGVHLIGPEVGWLSCRQQGAGRMSEPEAIAHRAQELLAGN